jgi:hypothetical protein
VEAIPDAMYKPMFRFHKAEFPVLLAMYDIPERVECEDRSVWSGHAALAVFLRRMSFPTRYLDLVMFFRRSKTALHGAFKYVLAKVYLASADRMQRISRDQLNDGKLREYADAIRARGFPMSNCFGLVDGYVTVRSSVFSAIMICAERTPHVTAEQFTLFAVPRGGPSFNEACTPGTREPTD